MMITAALVRPARCSRSARASARLACSRSALLGFRWFLAHGGGGTRGPRPARPPHGLHLGPPNRQFHDKLSGLYGSFGSSIGTSRVNACLAPSMRQSDTRAGAYSTLLAIPRQQWALDVISHGAVSSASEAERSYVPFPR